MIVGIDGNEANIERRVGVNEYAFQLLWNLWKLQKEWKSRHQLIVYLKKEPVEGMPEETANFKYKIIPGSGAWVLTKLMPRLIFNRDKLDIFFTPSHYGPPFSSVRRVVSIMDLGYLEFSGQFTKMTFWQLKLWTAISIFVSKAVIAISNATKRDIVRHYPFAKDKIYVTPLGFDRKFLKSHVTEKDVRRVKNSYSIVDDYILFVGTLKPSKNIEGLVEAFGQVHKKFPQVKLVLAGKKGWLFDSIFEKAKQLGLNDNIVYTDFVKDVDKPALIKGARLFVMPSFWEGFGIDCLSAMGAGTPVVASNVGSIPEVVGKAGILVDPNNIKDIARGLTRVLSMGKTDYNSMISKGFEQIKKFSWEVCARQTLKILENVSR